MNDGPAYKGPIEGGAQKPKPIVLVPFPDGRQIVQIYPLALSIPKHRDKYYLAEIVFGSRTISGVLYYPPQKDISGGDIESAFVFADKGSAVTAADAVTEVRILRELSPGEVQTFSDEVKKMLAR